MNIENNDNTQVTIQQPPRQEYILPFTQLENINLSGYDRLPTTNPPQTFLTYDFVHRWKKVTNFDWKASDKKSECIYSQRFDVNYLQNLIDDDTLKNMHEHFNYNLTWSIELRTTVQHAGALGVIWLPPCYQWKAGEPITTDPAFQIDSTYGEPWENTFNFVHNFYPKLLNPQENNVYQFSIPLSKIFDRYPTRAWVGAKDVNITMSDISMGTFCVFVYSPLNTKTDIDSLISIVRYKITDLDLDVPTAQPLFE